MKREFRSLLIILLVVVPLAAGGIYWLSEVAEAEPQRDSEAAAPGHAGASLAIVAAQGADQMPEGDAPQSREAPPEHKPASMAATPADVAAPMPEAVPPGPQGGKTRQQAYQFSIRDGTVTLDAVEPVQGDFHKRRGPLAWQPGMWCVRLLDSELRVLAQDTARAPDEACVVLDPNVLTPAGLPQASRLTATGEAVIQVRMPAAPGARWIRIYRLAGSRPAGFQLEPLGRLLASIPLPP